MRAMAKKKKTSPNSIAVNRRARFEYSIEKTYEAGIALQGWEVKSIREGKVQITEAYAVIHQNEIYLHGTHITPLLSASTHIKPEVLRSRKLLLHRQEIDQLIGAVERKGYALIPLSMYWKKGLVKVELGLGKGKKAHDKRAAAKDRDWKREKERMMKH